VILSDFSRDFQQQESKDSFSDAQRRVAVSFTGSKKAAGMKVAGRSS
jgi:hypothetical protein